MLRYIKLLFLTSGVVLTTSCSYIYGDNGFIQNRDTDYLKAKTGKTLVVPAGLSSSTIDTHYPVSDITHPDASKKVKLIPPELTAITITPEAEKTLAANATIPIQQKVPNYYFDQFSRSSTNKAGTPIAEVFNTIWPSSKKTSTSVQAVSSTAAPVKTASATKSGTSWRSYLPWGKKEETQNNAGQTPPEKSKMPAMYYDRFSGRQ